jgi:hypothetical protein
MKIFTLKKEAARCISVLAVSGLLSGCAVFWPPDVQSLDPSVETEADTSKALDTAARNQIAGCDITLSDPYLWRNWQPIVANPGSDGGSPLRASVLLVIVNRGDAKRSITWKGFLVDAADNQFPLRFTDRSQTPQHFVTLEPGDTYQAGLMAHNGPYLPVGSSASINFDFEVNSGHTGHLSSVPVNVERTD